MHSFPWRDLISSIVILRVAVLREFFVYILQVWNPKKMSKQRNTYIAGILVFRISFNCPVSNVDLLSVHLRRISQGLHCSEWCLDTRVHRFKGQQTIMNNVLPWRMVYLDGGQKLPITSIVNNRFAIPTEFCLEILNTYDIWVR